MVGMRPACAHCVGDPVRLHWPHPAPATRPSCSQLSCRPCGLASLPSVSQCVSVSPGPGPHLTPLHPTRPASMLPPALPTLGSHQGHPDPRTPRRLSLWLASSHSPQGSCVPHPPWVPPITTATQTLSVGESPLLVLIDLPRCGLGVGMRANSCRLFFSGSIFMKKAWLLECV